MKQYSWRQRFALVICSAWLSLAAADEAPKGRDAALLPPPPQTEVNKDQSDGPPRPAEKASYLLASQVDWLPLIAPPPEANSAEQQHDLQTVLDMQTNNGKGSARRDVAIADAEPSCFRIAYVLDSKLNEKQVPKVAEFLKKATADGGSGSAVLKSYWKRPRPFVVSKQVQRLADIDPENIKKKQQELKDKEEKDAKADKKKKKKPADREKEKKKQEEMERDNEYASYPSGHATLGTLCAIFLTAMVPEKQTEIFSRANEYRQSRLIVGAHFPSDIEAGRIVATATAAVMSQNFAFQRDLAVARAELRSTLGLSPELPNREKSAAKSP